MYEDYSTTGSRSKEIYSTFNMAARREGDDLPLRYNSRTNIAPDEELKRDISWIRKDAERKVLGALVKFHDRRVERSKSRLVKLEQESRKEKKKDMSDHKVPANTLEFSHEQKLENIQKKIDELNKMKYVLQNTKERVSVRTDQ